MPPRHDAKAAPHGDLLEMRRATAHFARCLSQLSDKDLRASERLRTLVADIALSGRLAALSTKKLRADLTADEAGFEADIPLAATLPIPALRHLFTHSAVHLNVELRDLESAHWPDFESFPAERAAKLWNVARILESHGHQQAHRPEHANLR